jgi:hypothetical protein
MDRVLRVTVPVTVKGEAPGVKQQSGILEFVHRIVEVECLPADIPEHIEVNVGDLMLHQGIRVRDVPVNPKVKLVDDADMMLVHVIMPKAEEAPAPAEGAAAAAKNKAVTDHRCGRHRVRIPLAAPQFPAAVWIVSIHPFFAAYDDFIVVPNPHRHR